jgi:hypothetical protein
MKRQRIEEDLQESTPESIHGNILSHPTSEDINVEEKDEDELPYFSDVESAISLILSRIPSNTTYPRIIFKHQLYPILQNQTEIEFEIENLRNNLRIRLLRFPNSFIGIIFHADYLSDIEKSIEMLESSDNTEKEQKKMNQEVISSLQKFIQWLSVSTTTSILESDLKTTQSHENSLLTHSDLQNIVAQGYLFPHRSSNASGLYYLSHHQVRLQ